MYKLRNYRYSTWGRFDCKIEKCMNFKTRKFDSHANAKYRISKHRKMAGIVIWMEHRKSASVLREQV
jgi:hypothetical protein